MSARIHRDHDGDPMFLDAENPSRAQIREFARAIGRLGGQSRSSAKRAAGAENLIRAREAKQAKREESERKTRKSPMNPPARLRRV